MDKLNPEITLRPDTTTLVIGDSNLRYIKEQDIPDNWQLIVLSGSKLSHAWNAIRSLPDPRRVTIVLMTGMNSRDNPTHKNNSEITDLVHAINVWRYMN